MTVTHTLVCVVKPPTPYAPRCTVVLSRYDYVQWGNVPSADSGHMRYPLRPELIEYTSPRSTLLIYLDGYV